ncbi:MAG TPA: DUF480 domain-containing protein [Pirellulales bacterium]|nr:DUF480 domain-containing protein [Pirellulales bacterium]
MSTVEQHPVSKPSPRWQPLAAIDRRVLGVLAEKAKTTPDAYPMSVNAICTGANQKNNRHPLMNLQPDDVEASLERLRPLGAVAEVQGGGRVLKYRHYLYDWLGVDKVELAVMTELLLRGAQTVGELRGRAARMEPIADLAALRPVLDLLKAKGLVSALSPEGRGQVVSHALYQPQEMEKIRRELAAAPVAEAPDVGDSAGSDDIPRQEPRRTPPLSGSADTSGAERNLVVELRAEVATLRRDLEELTAEVRRRGDELDRLRSSLGA